MQKWAAGQKSTKAQNNQIKFDWPLESWINATDVDRFDQLIDLLIMNNKNVFIRADKG